MENQSNTLNRRAFVGAIGAAGVAALAAPAASYQKFDSDAPLRVGMIGADGHTSYVTGTVKEITGAKFVAWAKGGPEGASRDTSRLGQSGETVYDDYREMFDKEQLDVVGICLPYAWNTAAAIAAAERGIHVITDKPCATTLADLGKLKKAVGDHNIRLTLMLNYRAHAPIVAMKEAIAAGRIGIPGVALSQKSYKFGNSRPWFYKQREIYGGTIPWIAIHGIDYMQYTTGFRYTHVSAHHANIGHPDYAACEDSGGVLLRCAGGGTAVINFDYLRPQGAPSHGDDRLRIIGSKGVMELKDLGQRVEIIEGDQPPADLPLSERKSIFPDFVDELRGGKAHVIPQEEVFTIIRVCLLAREAADTGKLLEI